MKQGVSILFGILLLLWHTMAGVATFTLAEGFLIWDRSNFSLNNSSNSKKLHLKEYTDSKEKN